MIAVRGEAEDDPRGRGRLIGQRAVWASAKSVLVVRSDHLGDLVLFTGALRRLRRLFPQSKIALATEERWKNFVEFCPYVDEWVAWERLRAAGLAAAQSGRMLGWRVPTFVERPARLARFLVRGAIAFRPSLLIIAMRSPCGGEKGTHVVAAAIPARWRVGIAGDFANQRPDEDESATRVYTSRLLVPAEDRWKHELEISARLVSLLGDPVGADEIWPEVWTTISDRERAAGMVKVTDGAISLVICPGAASRQRIYPSSAWVNAIASLRERLFDVTIVGTAQETALCVEMEERLRIEGNVRSVRNLAGMTSIRELVECIRRADVVLAADSAPAHLAIALRRPSVCVAGGGHPGRFIPWGDPSRNAAVTLGMDCYGCNWACHFASVRCIEEIPSEAVAWHLRRVLERARDVCAPPQKYVSGPTQVFHSTASRRIVPRKFRLHRGSAE